MTCKACTDAEAKPDSAFYVHGCDGCIARVVAITGGPELKTERYIEAMRILFGDRAKQAHELVKHWHGKWRQYKAATQGPAAKP